MSPDTDAETVTAVVVGEPDPIGPLCQRVQHAERETACATEVSA